MRIRYTGKDGRTQDFDWNGANPPTPQDYEDLERQITARSATAPAQPAPLQGNIGFGAQNQKPSGTVAPVDPFAQAVVTSEATKKVVPTPAALSQNALQNFGKIGGADLLPELRPQAKPAKPNLQTQNVPSAPVDLKKTIREAQAQRRLENQRKLQQIADEAAKTRQGDPMIGDAASDMAARGEFGRDQWKRVAAKTLANTLQAPANILGSAVSTFADPNNPNQRAQGAKIGQAVEGGTLGALNLSPENVIGTLALGGVGELLGVAGRQLPVGELIRSMKGGGYGKFAESLSKLGDDVIAVVSKDGSTVTLHSDAIPARRPLPTFGVAPTAEGLTVGRRPDAVQRVIDSFINKAETHAGDSGYVPNLVKMAKKNAPSAIPEAELTPLQRYVNTNWEALTKATIDSMDQEVQQTKGAGRKLGPIKRELQKSLDAGVPHPAIQSELEDTYNLNFGEAEKPSAKTKKGAKKNAIQEQGIMNDATAFNQNVISEGTQAQPGVYRKATGYDVGSVGGRNANPLYAWTEGVARNDPKAGGNPPKELLRKPSENAQSWATRVLADFDRNGVPIRAQGTHGANARASLIEIGARTPQEREWLRQFFGESATGVTSGTHAGALGVDVSGAKTGKVSKNVQKQSAGQGLLRQGQPEVGQGNTGYEGATQGTGTKANDAQTINAQGATSQGGPPQGANAQTQEVATHIWANADHDVPVTPTGRVETHTDGRKFSEVLRDGQKTWVPSDELKPVKPSEPVPTFTPPSTGNVAPNQGTSATTSTPTPLRIVESNGKRYAIHDPQIIQELDDAKARLDKANQWADSFQYEDERASKRKANAMQHSAEVRRILGTYTDKEAEAAIKASTTAKAGAKVSTPLGDATIWQSPAFGKVKVKTADGKIHTLPLSDITFPSAITKTGLRDGVVEFVGEQPKPESLQTTTPNSANLPQVLTSPSMARTTPNTGASAMPPTGAKGVSEGYIEGTRWRQQDTAQLAHSLGYDEYVKTPYGDEPLYRNAKTQKHPDHPGTFFDAAPDVARKFNARNDRVGDVGDVVGFHAAPRSLSPEEVAGMQMRGDSILRANQKARDAYLRAVKAGDSETASRLQQVLDQGDSDLSNIVRALDSSSSNVGRTLRLQRMAIAADNTPAGIEYTFRKANGGNLTPEMQAKVDKFIEQTKMLDAEQEDAIAKAANRNLKSESTATKTQGTKDVIQAKRAEAINRIKERMAQGVKSSMGKMNDVGGVVGEVGSMLYDIAPDVKAVVTSLLQEGVHDLASVVKGVLRHTQEAGIDLSEDDVRSIIAGVYDNHASASKRALTEIETLRKQMKTEAQGLTPVQVRKANAALERRIKKLEDWVKNDKVPESFKRVELPPEVQAINLKRRGVELEIQAARAKAVRDAEIAAMTPQQRKAEAAMQALSAFRTIKASTDISYPFNQGMFFSVTHPVESARAYAQSLRAIKSEDEYRKIISGIHAHPDYMEAKGAGLRLVDQSTMGRGEEWFTSKVLENPWSVKGVDLNPITASERVYSAMANKQRFNIYLQLRDALESKAGKLSAEELKQIAEYVNTATGVGTGNIARGLKIVNTSFPVFFAPGYAVSRWKLALGTPMHNALLNHNPALAKKIAGDYMKLATAILTSSYVASQNGAKVELDPRSGNFGKTLVAGQWVDTWGGLLKPMQFILQSSLGTLPQDNPSTGIPGMSPNLAFGGPARKPDAGILGRYVQGKQSPLLSTGSKLAAGQAFGKSYDLRTKEGIGNALNDLLTPISIQGIAETTMDPNIDPFTKTLLGVLQLAGASAYKPKELGARYTRDPAAFRKAMGWGP